MAYCIDCRDRLAEMTIMVQSAQEALEEIDSLLSRGFDVAGVSTVEGAHVSLFELCLLGTCDPIVFVPPPGPAARRARPSDV